MSPKHKRATLPRQPVPAGPVGSGSKPRPAAKKPDRLLSLLVLGTLAVVVVGIILLKQQPRDVVALSSAQAGSPASQASSSASPASSPASTSAAGNPAAVAGPFRPSSPADQLNQALAVGQPVLVFMHSNNCQSCIDMTNVVNQVYPEFASQIALVDVDVYDNANAPLMQKLGLRYIPTVVVFDKSGQSSQNVGAMKPDAFRTFLGQRALGG